MNNITYPASLHCHTHYSNLRLRDAITTVPQLIDRAIELGHKGIAFTEHETIANAIEIEEYWDKIKVSNPDFKILRGNEIYLVRNGLNSNNFNKERDKYTHFILLALDAEGHKQIRELSTRAWLRSYIARGMRRVPTYYQDLVDVIGDNKGHLIGTSACIGGVVGTQLLKYRQNQSEELYEKIKIWCNQIKDIFGEGNFYLEMQPSNNEEQVYVNKKIIELSHDLNIPTIITNDVHYLKKEDLAIEKIFLNAQGGDREVESFYATTYLMDNEEIYRYLYKQIGEEEIQKAYGNINKILNRAQYYSLKKPLKIPSLPWREINNDKISSEWYFYSEKIPALKLFNESPYKSDNYLVDAVIDGIDKHPDLQNEEAYKELNLCLEDTWISSQVNKAQWSAYFLNLQKVIDVCWEAGTIVGCGRGSGVGFLLLYCLDITQINPLRETTKTFRFRFLNPERVSVLDIDTDITGINRDKILNYIRNYYGQDHVANVLTLRTEKSKSAILAAARGLGVDIDIAQYIASLIPSERGALWPLIDCMYGNEAEGRLPIKQFVIEMTQNYPEIWNVVQKTEGLIVGMGEHAGGLVLVDEPFTESTALMRAPNGDVMTQFELHTSEKASLIKLDMLSVEAIDRIQFCLELLIEYGYIKKYPTLRETYENCIGIYNLERDDPRMWEMVYQQKIGSLFQMDAPSGRNAVQLTHPNSVDDLATINSVLRLMAQEKGAEMPLEKFARFKKNISLWYEEMRQWGLTEDEMHILEPIAKGSYGITESQEAFMQLVQMPECGGFDLMWADRLRKSIAKKNPKEFDQLTKEYFENCKEKGLSKNLCNYVWKVLVAYSRGYGFNKSHTLAYSLIALQEMNLAYKYPIMFWNCACLISDAGGNEENEIDEEAEEEFKAEEVYSNEMEEFNEEEDEVEDSYDEDEDCDGYPAEVIKTKDGKKKKKTKVTNHGKIATAIGKITSEGVSISPPDINYSTYTFSPDIENNSIRYGLSGITRIGEDLVKTIILNRPYNGIEDFLSKVKVNKPQMINLIKSGAFDAFGDRISIMHYYVNMISDTKKRITLQNMKMLIDFGLIPDEYDFQRRVYNFNKYLKKFKKGIYYGLDNIAFGFYSNNFDIDFCSSCDDFESGFQIKQTVWDKIYQKQMDIIRPFVQKNNKLLLEQVNARLTRDVWDKYCLGTISKWEMDSISCYIHPHELMGVNYEKYGLDRFADLAPEPTIDRFIPIKGKMVPIYKLSRIVGTVLDRDKAKKTVSLLTEDGVVTVKIYGVFQAYDRQISERGADGKKHVLRKSEFTRGNKIIITGVRDGENEFRAKVYKNTPFHHIETISEIDGENILIDNRNDEEV